MYFYIIFILIQFKAQTFTVFIPDYNKNTNISQINQINNNFQFNNNYYENQINILNNKLIQEKNKNQTLINENNNLKSKINNLNNKINKLNDKIKLLENNLSIKNMEIQNYKSKNNINIKNEITSILPGEKIIAVNFVSMGINDIGHYNLVCKDSDLFVRLEERLYEDFPQFKEYETYFEVKTKRIKRFKTLKDNNIQSNDVINMFIIDE